jgi:zinc protease
MSDEIVQTQLENGPDRFIKRNSQCSDYQPLIWYRVGSRNEVPGKTGISHWVEHMQF